MNNAPIRLALVGIGKIARDQHIPAIAANPAFELVATVSPSSRVEGVPGFPDLPSLLAAGLDVQAVSLCTPPEVRTQIARQALEAGLHVMLEKPPAVALSQAQVLVADAEKAQRALFATWHSREAGHVDAARDWLSGRTLKSVRIAWREDVRRWHPGQEWIFAAGGFGVFDPGINALSILTRIMPGAVAVEGAALDIPENREAPIAASLTMRHACGAPVTAAFDFLQTGPQTWEIAIETTDGNLLIRDGGSKMLIDGTAQPDHPDEEYPRLYARFAELVRDSAVDVDLAPLTLVADAFMLGAQQRVASFEF
ncbi:Gfo/Idh/MocA family protein [Novosphingobium rosa]|uniref:Gfo/Idh/MocA family protein n=1 Tax=Novosphingobium rosa TaxID=76978 RepID=UPI000AFE481F|nr:Gfo/Idh/MocA family oxidoreductase [Novosphingobium rosa]